MPGKPTSVLLVVDACVAQAMVDLDQPRRCRVAFFFVTQVLTICHRVICSSAIAEEWKRHSSSAFQHWRQRMEARKKVDRETPVPSIQSFKRRVERTLGQHFGTDQTKARAAIERVLKDQHILEGAAAADGVVVSMDRKLKDLLPVLSAAIPELRKIIWLDLENDEDACFEWLGQTLTD